MYLKFGAHSSEKKPLPLISVLPFQMIHKAIDLRVVHWMSKVTVVDWTIIFIMGIFYRYIDIDSSLPLYYETCSLCSCFPILQTYVPTYRNGSYKFIESNYVTLRFSAEMNLSTCIINIIFYRTFRNKLSFVLMSVYPTKWGGTVRNSFLV